MSLQWSNLKWSCYSRLSFCPYLLSHFHPPHCGKQFSFHFLNHFTCLFRDVEGSEVFQIMFKKITSEKSCLLFQCVSIDLVFADTICLCLFQSSFCLCLFSLPCSTFMCSYVEAHRLGNPTNPDFLNGCLSFSCWETFIDSAVCLMEEVCICLTCSRWGKCEI